MAAPQVRLQMDGEDAMRRRLERMTQEAPRELRRAAVAVADRLVPIVQQRTPFRTGKLHDSVRRRVRVSAKKEDISVSIVAGGPDIPYARIQHENLEFKHARGQAKFIESVLLESVPTLAQDIAGEVDLQAMAGQ